MKLKILDIFEYGNLNDNIFKSWKNLNKDQQILVGDFIKNVTEQKKLCGRNKGQYYDVFHYHIGYKNYNNYFNLNCKHHKCLDLVQNDAGLTSEGVLYYIKKNSQIYILAFGETHAPFPDPSLFFKILKNVVI